MATLLGTITYPIPASAVEHDFPAFPFGGSHGIVPLEGIFQSHLLPPSFRVKIIRTKADANVPERHRGSFNFPVYGEIPVGMYKSWRENKGDIYLKSILTTHDVVLLISIIFVSHHSMSLVLLLRHWNGRKETWSLSLCHVSGQSAYGA